jgi:hypothetical protein
MIQYAQLNKKKNCLAYFQFVLFNLEILVKVILAKIPEPGLPLWQGIWLDCGFCLFGRVFDQLFFQKSNSPGVARGGADRGWIWLVHKHFKVDNFVYPFVLTRNIIEV